MKILKRIFVCLVFFVSIFNRKTHTGETAENIFHLSYNHDDSPKKKSDNSDEVIARLNSLSESNRNAVMILLNSLYQQEVREAQKEFTLYTDKGCVKYHPLSDCYRNRFS